MKCFVCGHELIYTDKCPTCGQNVRLYKKIIASSNYLYNAGLEAAKEHNLYDAEQLLKQALKLNKHQSDARNLLGLIYYEAGEFAKAIEEWAISVTLRSEDNAAQGYLDNIYKDFSEMEMVTNVIRKYNQALQYCKQGNEDIALLQLKKVIGLYPNYIRANQLIALLYAKEGNYDKARSYLKSTLKIDTGNAESKRLLKEVEADRKESNKKRNRTRKDAVSYTNGNETIIQPRLRISGVPGLVINLVIGIAIGALTVYFLVTPAITSAAKSQAAREVAEANEQLAAKEASVGSLEDQITSLNEQLEKYKSEASENDNAESGYLALISLYETYAKDTSSKHVNTQAAFRKLDLTTLNKSALASYNELADLIFEDIEDDYDDAISAMDDEDYENAITLFKQVTDNDPAYSNGKAMYNLGICYLKNDNKKSATKAFTKVVDIYPDSKIAKKAQKQLDKLS